MNHKIDALTEGEDIVRYIRSQKIRWLGHIYRRGDRIVKKKSLRKGGGRPKNSENRKLEENSGR